MERKTAKTATAVFLAALLTLSATSLTIVAQAQAQDESEFFSIIQISDTQYLTVSNQSSALFSDLTNWINISSHDLNLKMVIHTGDIVDNGSDRRQWERANASMGFLLSEGVPYCWDAGDRDVRLNEATNAWIGNNYAAFNPVDMRAKSYWVSDLLDGKNTAAKFSVGEYDFLVVNMEYHPNATVLNWMTDLMTTYATSNVIVATHSYLNRTGSYDAGSETELYNTLNQFPNVFLVLSGHVYPNGTYHTQVRNREEILFDRQDIDNGLGAASARIMTFNAKDKMAYVNTYVAAGSTHVLSDPENEFNFPIDLHPLPAPVKTYQTEYIILGAVVIAACIAGWATIFREPKTKFASQQEKKPPAVEG